MGDQVYVEAKLLVEGAAEDHQHFLLVILVVRLVHIIRVLVLQAMAEQLVRLVLPEFLVLEDL
jgi:hypothetical protein